LKWIHLFSYPFSESQSSDDNKIDDRDRPSSSSTKKRKVLSFAEYVGSKKTVSSASSTIDSTQNKLTDTQIEEINAQFNANMKDLAASATDLAKNVNKKLTQKDKTNINVISDNHHSQPAIIEQQKPNHSDFWDVEDDDDDEQQAQPVPNNSNLNLQQVRWKYICFF
jgi:hypothetical protein